MGLLRVGTRLLVQGMAVAALAGCAQRDGHMHYNPTGFTAPDPIPNTDALTNYRLGSGDVITVTVFGVDSLSGDRTIDAAGNVTMPLIGAVPAADKTTDELQTALTTKFGARYLQNPQVTVSLKTAVSSEVTVDGSVSTPGLYPIGNKTTLLKTIAMAHGTSQGANPKKVVVFRQINGQRNAAAFDLTTIRNGVDPDPAIYPNDIVVVDGKQTSLFWTTVLQTVPLAALFTRF
jgi:polysaccharide export outer membrane protein